MGYSEIPFWLSAAFMLGGLAALAWSSDLFVDGAASLARRLGVSPFVVGMVVIGFGTSAPELCVSALSGLSGHADLSLGNAYGSCSFNIAAILGVAAVVAPIAARPASALGGGILLAAIALFSMWILRDGTCSRADAFALLAAFAAIMPLYCWLDGKGGAKGGADAETSAAGGGLAVAAAKTAVGLCVLAASAHFLVWGAVDFARMMGVGDLVVGLTVVAAGTSLPELASAVAAARRGEPELVLGNIVGSNIFNTLAVVGIATALQPAGPGGAGAPVSPQVLARDLPAVAAFSLSLAAFGANWRHPSRPGRIGRWKAAAWILAFAAYAAFAVAQAVRN